MGPRETKNFWRTLKNQVEKIRRVGLIGNAEKAPCGPVVKEAAALVMASGREVCMDRTTAELSGLTACVLENAADVARCVDLLLVFGGDGTMLRVAAEIAGEKTPILGINIGSLGFLTAVPSGELEPAMRQVFQGDFWFEHRQLIEASGNWDGRDFKRTALNDIVISRGTAARLIELDVAVDKEALTRYRCDGLIFSTPTGSTAYSLAAGGAVVFPTSKVMTLTPICPHTLSNRSLILPLTSTVEVRVISPKLATMLSADGESVTDLAPGDLITIRRSRKSIRLMHLAGSSFCETLRRKLHWRGTPLPI